MRFFFIVAMGRSGTHFLQSLLAEDPRAAVHHEPSPWDPQLHVLGHTHGRSAALDAALEERFAPLLEAAAGKEVYGETNSYLRFHVDWLKERFDPALIHVVRDGRAYVRSAWTRPAYTAWETEGPILPKDEPWLSRWASMDRFERLCWSWLHTNEELEARVDNRVRFEDLLKDYDALRRHVLEPTGIEISHERWQHEVGRPKNTSRQYKLKNRLRRLVRGGSMPPEIAPLDWTPEHDARFDAICGTMMERYGYGTNRG